MAFIYRTLAIVALLSSVALAGEYHEEESHGHAPGYSYAKFSGPVTGPEHKVEVHDKHGHPSYDYTAHPSYKFEYGVEDPKSHVSQKRQEHRDGDDVHGEYTVAQPDGKIRTVKYYSDKHNGFTAEVTIDGKPLHHDALEEQQQHLAQQAEHLSNHQSGHHQTQILHEEPSHGYGGGAVEETHYGGYEGGEEVAEGGHEYY